MNIEIEHNINYFSLKELSIEAARLWEQLEQLDSEEGDLDIEVWQSHLEAIAKVGARMSIEYVVPEIIFCDLNS